MYKNNNECMEYACIWQDRSMHALKRTKREEGHHYGMWVLHTSWPWLHNIVVYMYAIVFIEIKRVCLWSSSRTQCTVSFQFKLIDKIHATSRNDFTLLHDVNLIWSNIVQEPLVMGHHEDGHVWLALFETIHSL